MSRGYSWLILQIYKNLLNSYKKFVSFSSLWDFRTPRTLFFKLKTLLFELNFKVSSLKNIKGVPAPSISL